jgi:hypothetical protein
MYTDRQQRFWEVTKPAAAHMYSNGPVWRSSVTHPKPKAQTLKLYIYMYTVDVCTQTDSKDFGKLTKPAAAHMYYSNGQFGEALSLIQSPKPKP